MIGPLRTRIRAHRKLPHYQDSYAIRALAVAYDITGKKDTSRRPQLGRPDDCLSGEDDPGGRVYMNYGRKPGESKGSWYVADSSSIALGVLAVAIRCEDAAVKRRYSKFRREVCRVGNGKLDRPKRRIRNGQWPKFDGEWWCSSGIFGSLLFMLYNETGERALP